jgi:coenzyme PQQ biosynthesis protein C
MTGQPSTVDRLEGRLRALGETRYHDKHPFHLRLHEGRCSRTELQAWALNRSYYQTRIPIKDAALMARCDDRELRRCWRSRLVDHDGNDHPEGAGGIEKWLALTTALGFDRDDVLQGRGVLPATKFAVEAYVAFVRERSLLEAVASSLTEMFAPQLVELRQKAMLAHYGLEGRDLAYFDSRPSLARRDSEFALAYVKRHATSSHLQDLVVQALAFKCDVLWAMLDAVSHAYVEPASPPPGCWRHNYGD